MENSCRSSDLLMKVQATTFTRFMLLEVAGPRNFLALQRTRTIGQTARASHFGRIRAAKLIVWRGWCVKRAARRLKGPRFVWVTVPAIMRLSLRTRLATSCKFAAGKVR